MLQFSFVKKHVYITTYVYVSTGKYQCIYVRVYLIQSRVRKEFVLPLWETILHKSAFFELFPLLNYLYQGHEMVEMLTKERIRVLYKGTVHQDCNCLSALSGPGWGSQWTKTTVSKNNGILCDLEPSWQRRNISSLPSIQLTFPPATSTMPASQTFWTSCFFFWVSKSIPSNGQTI